MQGYGKKKTVKMRIKHFHGMKYHKFPTLALSKQVLRVGTMQSPLSLLEQAPRFSCEFILHLKRRFDKANL